MFLHGPRVFHLGLAPQIQACSEDHLCPQRPTHMVLRVCAASFVGRNSPPATAFWNIPGLVLGSGWVVGGQSDEFASLWALLSTPPQWGCYLQHQGWGVAEAETNPTVPKSKPGEAPASLGFPHPAGVGTGLTWIRVRSVRRHWGGAGPSNANEGECVRRRCRVSTVLA